MCERIISWFSSGASSAIASKVAVEMYSKTHNVEVVNINMEADEHPDNIRFRLQCEEWIGQPIIQIQSTKYKSTEDVFLKTKYIAGVTGAACTKRLKREVQMAYQKPDDRLVVGYTSDERARMELLVSRWPNERFLWLLINAGITKEDCYHILSAAGIELPIMYKLGYDHNNCLGCVKGGKGYWNKIRIDFPEVFKRRAAVERIVGFPILRDVWLDELDPSAGRDMPLPKINCGLFCEGYNDLIPLAVENTRELSI